MPRWRAAELVREASMTAFDENPGIPPGDIDDVMSVLRVALERFDSEPAEAHLQRLSRIFTPGVILRDVVLPFLREVGERWECGEATIAQEHFASCFLESWMLGRARGWGRAGARRAVLACIPGEHHALGLIAFGVALRELNWSITFLGRDTPVGSVRRAAEAVEPDAVVLAGVMPEALAIASDDIAGLAADRTVLLGGAMTATYTLGDADVQILPADLLAAAKALTLALSGPDERRPSQAALGSRGSGSGTASMSAGVA